MHGLTGLSAAHITSPSSTLTLGGAVTEVLMTASSKIHFQRRTNTNHSNDSGATQATRDSSIIFHMVDANVGSPNVLDRRQAPILAGTVQASNLLLHSKLSIGFSDSQAQGRIDNAPPQLLITTGQPGQENTDPDRIPNQLVVHTANKWHHDYVFRAGMYTALTGNDIGTFENIHLIMVLTSRLRAT